MILRISVVTLALLLTSCTCSKSGKENQAAVQGALGKVGDYTITKSDVALKNKIIRIYYPNEKRDDVGILQLKRAYTYAMILKNNGHPINDEVLAKEEERIDLNTLMPKRLQEIKDVFDGDMEAYRRVFILPTYAERVIYYDFFLHDKEAQKPSLEVAEKFLQAVGPQPATFEEVAKAQGRMVAKLHLDEYEGLKWQRERLPGEPPDYADKGGGNQSGEGAKFEKAIEIQQRKVANKEAQKWMDEVIGPLKPGQVFPQVIDHNESWLVVRYLKKMEGPKRVYELQAVSFPKSDYNEWLKKETAKIEISGV